ncbi:MAG: rod-binding protein [Spirochaetaceae bacterium]|jgi:flagellar protein FlgJ|nr:rod-binding protein [Spirochaetaceae bacterium]
MAIIDTAQVNLNSSQSMAQLNRMENAGQLSIEDDKKLREACQDFEAILIKQMLDAMKKTLPEGSLIEKNQGEKIFEDMLYQEYAKTVSREEPMGVSDMMYRQMVRQNKGDLY